MSNPYYIGKTIAARGSQEIITGRATYTCDILPWYAGREIIVFQVLKCQDRED